MFALKYVRHNTWYEIIFCFLWQDSFDWALATCRAGHLDHSSCRVEVFKLVQGAELVAYTEKDFEALVDTINGPFFYDKFRKLSEEQGYQRPGEILHINNARERYHQNPKLSSLLLYIFKPIIKIWFAWNVHYLFTKLFDAKYCLFVSWR